MARYVAVTKFGSPICCVSANTRRRAVWAIADKLQRPGRALSRRLWEAGGRMVAGPEHRFRLWYGTPPHLRATSDGIESLIALAGSEQPENARITIKLSPLSDYERVAWSSRAGFV